jgi:hypothetical protein
MLGRLPRRRLLLALGAIAVVAVVVVIVAVAGGGEEDQGPTAKDPAPKNPRFHTRATADHYGGPSPFNVKFTVDEFNVTGDVEYRWNFDDGTVSKEKEPVHTFPKPGTYQVIMDARDEKHNDRWNLVIGVWPPRVWTSTKPADIPKVQADQKRRTEARRRRLDAESARRLEDL